jgi:DNA-binding transcriptional ArsR family regulator
VNWQLLARTNTHPLRVSILEVLSLDGGRTLSPKDLSLELQAPLSTINYHVTQLTESGLLRLRGERQVRGAIEHFYQPVDSPANGQRDSRNRSNDRREEGGKRRTGFEPATSA